MESLKFFKLPDIISFFLNNGPKIIKILEKIFLDRLRPINFINKKDRYNKNASKKYLINFILKLLTIN